MLIAGLICLALAGVALYLYLDQRKKLRAATRTETLQCGQLSELSQAAAEAVGAGSFSHACELVGPAVAPEQGPMTAPESKQACVWHRTKLTEHYWDWERDSDGDRRRVRRTREIHSHTSESSFFVDDGTGRVAIDPKGADIDGEDKVVDRMEEDRGRMSSMSGLVGIAQSIFQAGDNTIGIEHEEWIIRPGARLYVLGEASDRSGQLELAKPDDGPMVISTRSEEEYVASTRSFMKWSLVGAIVLGIAAPVLIVLGIVNS